MFDRRRVFPGSWTLIVAAMLCGAQVGQGRAASDGTTKVVVERGGAATVSELQARGASVVADRGAYTVLTLDAARAKDAAATPGVAVRDDFDTIGLRRTVIDARKGPAPAPGILRSARTERRLKLVQLSAPPTDNDLQQLRAAGATIVHYVPQNAFLVWTDAAPAARALEQLATQSPALQYYGDFHPDYALAPALDAALGSSEPVEVTVQIFNHGKGTDDDVAQVERLAQTVVRGPWEALQGRYLNLRIVARGSDLDDIAQINSVVTIEPYIQRELFDERQGQILAGNLDGALQNPSGPGYLTWLAGKGFSTSQANYPVVVVVDDGVDNGTTTPANAEFRELNNGGLPSRITFAVLPPGSSASSANGPDGHGNINASIVGAYNNGTGAAVEDGSGFNYGLGISPYGRLANVRIFTPGFDNGTGNSTMASDYYTRGARISTNSWGANTGGTYDTDAQEYDALTRDAQSGSGGNQQLLFVFAAGNAGPGTNTVGSPGTAKNVITVGASESSNPAASAGDGCGDSAGDGNDARDMASFSSRGPCDDSRIKPDIVAPGTFIQGAASQPTFNGSGVCGAVTNDFVAPGTDALFPAGSAYTWSSGTSHSTPAIAGDCSLVGEFLNRVYGIASPSPALSKAYIIHSGRHLTGNGANEDLPGRNQGFGLADMGLAFDTSAPRFLYDQGTVFGNSGETISFTGVVPNPSRPVRIALVWTDAPGPAFGNAYMNDLNLVVTAGPSTYLGNHMVLGMSQTGGTADTRNNAEAVFLPAGNSGAMTIRVDAMTIAADGVPGNGDSTDQDFALVAYNFTTQVSAGIITLNASTYSCASSVGIQVFDSDLVGTGTLAVGVATTGGDAETVTLTETPASSGIFTGSIPATTGAVVIADGTLQVAHGETITATYNDADDGTSNPATVQDTATVDCQPPVTSNVATINITGSQARVTLTTDETATVQVHYGLSCASLTNTQFGGAAGTSHQVDLSGLSTLTPYFFTVEATDGVGNTVTDDNGGSCYTFTTTDQADYFTEIFTANDNDLDNQMLTFTPDGSGDFYSACRAPALVFPTDPSGGTPISLTDDDSVLVTLTGGAQVKLYGTSYGSFYVGSNGYITFLAPDATYTESLAEHFSLPRVAPLFDDFNPAAGGSVSWKQLSDRAVVTYQSIPEYGTSNSNSFQVELFFDGRIRITYLGIAAADGLAGLSHGLGLPGDFVESNLNGYGLCSAGTVSLNRATYGCFETLTATVVDADLAGSATLNVALTTTGGDSQTLTLTETPPNSAVFVGAIPTSVGTITTNDGVLQVINGDVITATYDDANDGNGPATVQYTATVACACDATPLTGCHQPLHVNRSVILFKNNADDTKDQLLWKWVDGDVPNVSALGNPISGATSYYLCVYDRTSGAPALTSYATISPGGVCGSQPCWAALGATGFRYRNNNPVTEGIKLITLRAGANGTARIIVRGKGKALRMPSPAGPTQLLHQDTTVTVQMRNSNGTCWSADYSSPALKNVVEKFRDKNG